MLVKSLAGLLLVRRRVLSVWLGDAMGNPPFSGAAFGFAAQRALAGHPQIHDLNHA